MDTETEKKIEQTVIEILRNSDMDKVTEFMIRESASKKLGMNLSDVRYKKFVRQVVESYLSDEQSNSKAAEAVEAVKNQKEDKVDIAAEEEEEEVDEDEGSNKKRKAEDKEYDEEGDLIICRLSKSRRVTITEFRGKTLVSMREYYRKEGKELPTSKGISLATEQWETFSKNVHAIEKAIRKMESRLN